MTDVPHFAFPFRWSANGRALVVEQDSYEEIEQNVRVLLLSHEGERLEAPGFGIVDPTFHTEADVDAMRAAAVEWDERAAVVLQERYEEMNAMIRLLLVQVSEREG